MKSKVRRTARTRQNRRPNPFPAASIEWLAVAATSQRMFPFVPLDKTRSSSGAPGAADGNLNQSLQARNGWITFGPCLLLSFHPDHLLLDLRDHMLLHCSFSPKSKNVYYGASTDTRVHGPDLPSPRCDYTRAGSCHCRNSSRNC
jgi:hypothetical protein